MMKTYKNSPILFVVSDNVDDGIQAYITSQDFWEKHHCLDDRIRRPKDTVGPWANNMEAVMGWCPTNNEERTMEAAHQSMIANGFVFSAEMAKFIAETGNDIVFWPTNDL